MPRGCVNLSSVIPQILHSHDCLPLDMGGALHLNKLESPSPKEVVEIGPVVLLEKILKFRPFIFAIS